MKALALGRLRCQARGCFPPGDHVRACFVYTLIRGLYDITFLILRLVADYFSLSFTRRRVSARADKLSSSFRKSTTGNGSHAAANCSQVAYPKTDTKPNEENHDDHRVPETSAHG